MGAHHVTYSTTSTGTGWRCSCGASGWHEVGPWAMRQAARHIDDTFKDIPSFRRRRVPLHNL